MKDTIKKILMKVAIFVAVFVTIVGVTFCLECHHDSATMSAEEVYSVEMNK